MDKRPLWAIIPAKGNSRRCPGKNAKLAPYVIRAAVEAKCFDRVIVSSDDVDILENAMMLGAETFQRAPILCEDGVTAAMVVADVLACNYYACRSFALLWPTNPLIMPKTLNLITHAFLHVNNEHAYAESTAVYMTTNLFIRAPHFRVPILNRENMWLPIPFEENIDVNEPEDLARAEAILASRNR